MPRKRRDECVRFLLLSCIRERASAWTSARTHARTALPSSAGRRLNAEAIGVRFSWLREIVDLTIVEISFKLFPVKESLFSSSQVKEWKLKQRLCNCGTRRRDILKLVTETKCHQKRKSLLLRDLKLGCKNIVSDRISRSIRRQHFLRELLMLEKKNLAKPTKKKQPVRLLFSFRSSTGKSRRVPTRLQDQQLNLQDLSTVLEIYIYNNDYDE